MLLHGKIVTCNTNDSVAEAVAVKNDILVAVGRNSLIENLADHRTKVIDLKGRTVTPGLIDTHTHCASTGLSELQYLDLAYPRVKSIGELARVVSEKVAKAEKGEWILGRGWDEALLEERRPITKWDLDSISPNNPVVLVHTSGHSLVTNSYGLRIAGIGRETQSPPGSTIDVKDGEPTGFLKEAHAMNLLLRNAPAATVDQIKNAVIAMESRWLQEGVTTIRDCGIYGDSRVFLEAYESLNNKSELKLRVCFTYPVSNAGELRSVLERIKKPDTAMLRHGAVKTFLDGSCMLRTAWMYETWNKNYLELDDGNKGYPIIDIDEFKKLVQFANDEGLQVCIHAIGDKAIDMAVEAIEKAVSMKREDCRHSLVHAILPRREIVDKIRRLGIVIETQSAFMYFLGDSYAGNLGPRRAREAFPLKTLISNGVTVGNGSDTDVCPLAPRYGLWAACIRKPLKGLYGFGPFGTEESLTAREALRTYTIEAAKCLRWEHKIGSIEVGKYADLAVWSDDMYNIPPDELKDLSVMMTIIGGEILYRSPEW